MSWKIENTPLQPDEKILVRPATVDDFQQFISWMSQDEIKDWHLSRCNFDLWKKSFNVSILAAVDLGTSGRTVGFCSGVKHKNGVGFVGLYFVEEPYRGRGIGGTVLRQVLAFLEGSNLCLTAGEKFHDILYINFIRKIRLCFSLEYG